MGNLGKAVLAFFNALNQVSVADSRDDSSIATRPVKPPSGQGQCETSSDGLIRQAAVNALLEDFKARWQELLNFEAEVSRWFTLYVTAVIAVIGWLMGDDRPSNVQALFKGNDGLNSILVLLIAFLNAVYVLALAFNGYRIQQIGQYLYSEVGQRLTAVTGEPFNTWEAWRRKSKDQSDRYGPELIRQIYFVTVGLVPVLVSLSILAIYWWFEGSTQARLSGHNVIAYIVLLSNLVIAGVALSTTRQNVEWAKLIEARRAVDARVSECSQAQRA